MAKKAHPRRKSQVIKVKFKRPFNLFRIGWDGCSMYYSLLHDEAVFGLGSCAYSSVFVAYEK